MTPEEMTDEENENLTAERILNLFRQILLPVHLLLDPCIVPQPLAAFIISPVTDF